MLTRRIFLTWLGTGDGRRRIVPFWLGRAPPPRRQKRKTLVAIFQRGAADGLNVVVPFARKALSRTAPHYRHRRPGQTNGKA